MSRLKGKISEWLGVTTGDRETEARGKVEQRDGRDPDAAQVRDELKKVKQGHHDYGERVPPQQVPHTDR